MTRRSPSREKTGEIVALYAGGIGTKSIAKILDVSPRIARVILIEQGVYKPGALYMGEAHLARRKATLRETLAAKKEAEEAEKPAWRREVERRADVKPKHKHGASDLELFAHAKSIRTPEKKEISRVSFARRYAEDIEFKLKHVLRARVRKVVKRGDRYSEHTLEWLGCTPVELIAHLENLWARGMTWGNYGCKEGQWSIDHIRPCASFDLLKASERAKCFHYKNMQPLWHIDNIRKNDKYDGPTS